MQERKTTGCPRGETAAQHNHATERMQYAGHPCDDQRVNTEAIAGDKFNNTGSHLSRPDERRDSN